MHVEGPNMLQIQRCLVGFGCSNGRVLTKHMDNPRFVDTLNIDEHDVN